MAQQNLANYQQRKLLALAKDILAHGLNPAELPIVVPTEDRSGRYTVLDGNRRLVALKMLENPESFAGAIDPGVLQEFRKLTREYQERPVESVHCLVVKDREEADHWIHLRHTGQHDGAGLVPWGPDEQARFRSRGAQKEFHIQVLDFLESYGLTNEKRRKTPTSTLRRLLSTPEVRSKTGIGLSQGNLEILGEPKRVAKALLHIVEDLASRRVKVKEVYTSDDRKAYAQKFPTELVVRPSASARPSPPGRSSTSDTGARRKKLTLSRRPDVLIPPNCILGVTDRRIAEIEKELRKLVLSSYPNAISVLFRVFVELSVDHYLNAEELPLTEKDPLGKKMRGVLHDLYKHKKLTKQQAAPVQRAVSRDHFFAPSVLLFHAYVHNKHMFPASGDLRASWDSLQHYFMAIWPA